jgi:phosphomannomutase
MLDNEFTYERWDKIGKIINYKDASGIHIKKVLKVINVKKIKQAKIKTVLDSVNGAGSEITIEFLKGLGCKVIPLYCIPNGIFPRGAEPLAENLKDLSKRVIAESADIGFAQDPDADRLAIVDENGVPIGEENTISLVAEHLLSKKKGRVVVNLSTTKTVEDIALKYGVPFKRTKVGEINVVDEMRRAGARIGGEGNGGVISPEIHLGRDSLAGIGYILEMMAERKKTVSELVKELPVYVMKKGKIKFDADLNVGRISLKLKNSFKNEIISELDGIRIDFICDNNFKGGWVHLRASNTEPVFRIIAEGKNRKQVNMIYNHFAEIIK